MTTAVTIKALMTYTKRAGATVPAAIPHGDLEPLLTSGFVRLEHLEPVEGGGYRMAVEGGEMRQGEQSSCAT